jgi:hypothetical protein
MILGGSGQPPGQRPQLLLDVKDRHNIVNNPTAFMKVMELAGRRSPSWRRTMIDNDELFVVEADRSVQEVYSQNFVIIYLTRGTNRIILRL